MESKTIMVRLYLFNKVNLLFLALNNILRLCCRYEKLPTDFRTPFMLNLEALGQPLSLATGRTTSSTMAFLSRYFLQQRWVWTVQSGPGGVVSLQAVAHILSTLAE